MKILFFNRSCLLLNSGGRWVRAKLEGRRSRRCCNKTTSDTSLEIDQALNHAVDGAQVQNDTPVTQHVVSNAQLEVRTVTPISQRTRRGCDKGDVFKGRFSRGVADKPRVVALLPKVQHTPNVN